MSCHDGHAGTTLRPVRNPTTRASHVEAEEDVREPVDAASAADLEHGASGDDDGESEEHRE